MKQYTIKIINDDVYINNEFCRCDYPMNKENKEDDLNKRVILSLANKMGYEPIFLFEEMVDRLDEMTDEEEYKSYTAFAYEDDGITQADLSTYDNEQEAVEFAKSRNWDKVVNDITGEVIWRR